MIHTIRIFVLRVETLIDISQASDVFEDECSDKLRNQIYALADPEAPEPFRDAMHRLGYQNY